MTRLSLLFFAVVLFVCSAALKAQAAPPANLVELRKGLTFYAPFENADLGAWEAAGNANELAHGKGGKQTRGKIGSALLLPSKGHATYMTRGNLDGMAATVSFWMRPDVEALSKFVADHRTKGGKQSFWEQRFFTTSWGAGRVYIGFRRGSPLTLYFYDWHPSGPRRGAGKRVELNKLAGWHLVTCEWGNGHKRVYWDGQLAEDTTAATGWRLGTRLGFAATIGHTVYDELMIWNRMLSADEVRALYQLGQAGTRIIDRPMAKPPAPAPTYPAPGINLLRNAGFELGLADWELLYPPLKPTDVLDDSGDAPQGPICVKVSPRPTTGRNEGWPRILQGPFHVQGGQYYTISVYLKSNRDKPTATVFLANAQGGSGKWSDLRKKVTLTNQWQKVTFTGTATGTGDCLAYFGVQFEGRGKGAWWADQAQVYLGDQHIPCRPARPVTFALSTGKIANIFHKGDAIKLDLQGWQNSDLHHGSTVPLTLSVEDYHDRQIDQMKVEGHTTPEKVSHQTLTLPVTRSGPMRAVLRAGDDVLAELNFTMIPFTQAQSNTLGQFLGGELNPNDWHCAAAYALGIRWALPLDCSPATLWKYVEAKRGTYNWDRQDDIACYRKWGLNVVGVIDHAPKWAAAKKAWKSVPAKKYLGDFQAYVYQTVHHYKGQIHDWLIWDEMDQHTGTRGGSVDLYMDMIKRAYQAAHKADPQCKVLAPCSTGNNHWGEALVKRGLLKYTDIWSMDLWSTRYPTIKQLVQLSRSDGKDRPFWDHGTGVGSRTFYRYLFPETNSTVGHVATYRDAAIQLAKLVIDRRAAGVDKMFYYWIVKKQCTPGHAALGFFEFDGSIRPFAAAYAILGQYLYQYTPVRSLHTPDNLTGFLFRNKADGTPLAVLYADRPGFVADATHALRDTDMSARLAGDPRGVFVRLDTTLKPGQYVVKDMMLNPTDSGVAHHDAKTLSLWIGEAPVLIEGHGLTVNAFATALSGQNVAAMPGD